MKSVKDFMITPLVISKIVIFVPRAKIYKQPLAKGTVEVRKELL